MRFVEAGLLPQERVVLVCRKNTDAIVALFASLFAGAVYVPLHPRWPKERIEETIGQCSPRLVITEENEGLRITDRLRGVRLDASTSSAGTFSTLPRLDPAAPALILFTSGSTGRCKGVVLTHNAVAAFVRWSAEEFHITEADRIACPSPLGFDLSTFDIFNMALRGATCVILSENIVWMPRFLVQALRELHITCWYSVPSILSGMDQGGRLGEFSYPNLRLVLFAGEVFPAPGISSLQRSLPGVMLANLYGPTETNVVTWAYVPAGFDGTNPLPIGRACPYAKVMLDKSTGELLAGGDSLMIGYWNKRDETERVFRRIGDQLYYSTGDRVSVSEEGDLLFLGRMDRQIKRRGFRIELGEIERALARHEKVAEAAAVAVESFLVAFVSLRSGEILSAAEARDHCSQILPAYMLPDRVIIIDVLPRGGRGKIDYIALASLTGDLERGHKD
jgi:amino acid adenylation domain-containing protein